MGLDPALVSETREWLARAFEDLRAAEFEFGASPPFLSDIVFHAQQAAEKALKGFLTWNSTSFRRTHSLEEIGAQCVSIDPSFGPLIHRAVPLTEYAWKFRYPGEAVNPSHAEARDALDLAREVFESVVARLPTATRP